MTRNIKSGWRLKNKDGDFDLELVDMSEVELFKFMTDKDYDVTKSGERSKTRSISSSVDGCGKTTLAAMLAICCAIITNWKPYFTRPLSEGSHSLYSRQFSDEF